MSDNEYEQEDEDGFKTWAIEGLDAHNEYRALHDAPPLTLNKEVIHRQYNCVTYSLKSSIWGTFKDVALFSPPAPHLFFGDILHFK